MKDNIKQIVEVLSKSEREVQEIIGDAASKADYAAVDAGRIAAIEISKLQTRLDVLRKQYKSSGGSATIQKEKRLSQVFKPSGYPKYEVRNDTLIRTGWSKKEKVEYTHCAPKEAFDSTVKVMEDLAKGKAGPITAEEIITTINDVESIVIPSYQIYVAIGMLRQKGYIKKLGRKGYEMPSDIASKAKKEWENLAGKNYRD